MRTILICAAFATALTGCATSDFCDTASPIRPSIDDKVTPGTQTQILKHNSYGAKRCGWK